MGGLVVSAMHALLVAVVLAALVSLDVSLAAKALFGALSGVLVFALLLLRDQAEHLARIHTTLRTIFVAVETRRLDRQNKRRAIDILAADIEQENSDQEIRSALSGHRSNSVVYWVIYLLTVAIMTTVGVAVWPQ